MPPESQRQIPRARDYFCGPNAPVGRALVWCGWEVEAIDILLDKRADLSNRQFQEKLDRDSKEFQAHIFAIECTTLTRAREKPIPGHPNPPVPLRNSSEVRGIRNLGRKDAEKVESANSFIDFSLDQAEPETQHCEWRQWRRFDGQ